MERLGDIYFIVHVETKKFYVGQAVQEKMSGNYMFKHGYKHRVREHFVTATSNSGHNNDIPKLYNAIRIYGKQAFLCKRIETCPISLLDEREKWWIRIFDCINSGFNSHIGGNSSQLKSESLKELWQNEDYRKKQTDTHTEQWKTDEYRERYFEAIHSRERENKLPHNIYLSRKNGVEVGYEVTIKRDKKNFRKQFCSTKLPMEQKLQLAIQWRDEMLASLGNNV